MHSTAVHSFSVKGREPFVGFASELAIPLASVPHRLLACRSLTGVVSGCWCRHHPCQLLAAES